MSKKSQLVIPQQQRTPAYDGTIWNNNQTFAANVTNPSVTHHTVYYSLTKETVGVNVYLPPEYATFPNATFPVIYLFYPAATDENFGVDQLLTHFAAAYPCIVVDANLGYWQRARDADPASAMFNICMADSLFVNDVKLSIDSRYRTTGAKGGWAATGMSAGGGSALRMAFKYPQLFSSVYAYSAAAVFSNDTVVIGSGQVAGMFNGDGALFDAQNAQQMATNNAANIIAQNLAIFFSVGDQDTTNSPTGIYQINLDLDSQLTSLGIPHTMQVVPGVGHDLPGQWAFEGGHKDLDFMANHFSGHTPILWTSSISNVASSTADCSVFTNTANGTLFVVVTTSATKPSAAQIIAGQNNLGTAAVFAGNQSVSTVYQKTITASGLSASTAYFAHFTHRNAGSVASNVVSTAQFTTTAAGSGYSAEAQQFFSRIADPGTTRKNLYAAMIDGLVADGVWAQLDALYILAAPDSATALINLVSSSYAGTLVNGGTALTFTADRGFNNSGTSSNASYIDTNFNAATAGGHYAQNSSHLAAWIVGSSTASNGLAILGNDANGNSATIMPRLDQAGGTLFRVQGNIAVAGGNRQGWWAGERPNSTTVTGYQNGAQTGTGNPATNVLFNATFVGLSNRNGTTNYNNVDQIAAMSLGASLGSTGQSNLYSRLNTYMTAVGAAGGGGISLTATPSSTTQVGQAYSQTNVASGGTAPYTYAVSAGTLPAGTSLNTSSGTVSGTPTTAGAFSYTIQATDNAAQTATAVTNGTMSSGGGSYSTEAAQFFARITDPGTPRKDLYAALIDGLVADGVWSKLDALLIYAAPLSATALTNLVSASFPSSLVNGGTALTFTTDRGFNNSGAISNASYIETSFNFATGGHIATQNSWHASAWANDSSTTTASVHLFGNALGTGQVNLINKLDAAGGMLCRCNDAAGDGSHIVNANRQGHYLETRLSASARLAYINASFQGIGNTNSVVHENQSIHVLHATGHTNYNNVDQVSMFSVGGSLSSTEATNFYNRLRTFMTAVGVPATGGGGGGSISPPAFATARGYSQLYFSDEFDSSGDFDVTGSNAPGYKWYILNRANIGAQTANYSNSIVSLSEQHVAGFTSAANLAGLGGGLYNSGSVGKLLTGRNGFYAECRMQTRADQSTGNSEFSWWMIDYLAWIQDVAQGQTAPPNLSADFAEIDVQESWTPPQDNYQTYHAWSKTLSFSENLLQAPGAGTFNNLDWTQFHTWGVLVVPAAQNGGTGLMQFFVDRVQRGGDITWSPGTLSAAIENSHPFLLLGGPGAHGLTQVDYVYVWNAGANGWDGPSTNLTHRWPMNDARVSSTTISDVVGSLHGTAGSGISSTIGPMCDQARLSNGTTAQGYITLPSAPIASLTAAWSIAGWVKMTNVAAGGASNSTICQLDDGTTRIRFVVDHTSTVGALGAVKNGPTSLFATAAPVFSSGFYNHFIITYNGAGTYTVYKNGVAVSIGGTAISGTPSTGNCLMAESSGAANSWPGAMAQFVTYTKALTATEAAQLYNSYEMN